MSSITEERLSAALRLADDWAGYIVGHALRELVRDYRAEVVAREKAESEREELRVMIERMMVDWLAFPDARDLLARLKDGGT